MKDSTVAENDPKWLSQARSFRMTGVPLYIEMGDVFYVPPAFGPPAFGPESEESQESEQFFAVLASQAKNILRSFEVRNQEDILNYLMVHDYLISVLEEAPSAIYKHFPEVPLSLEIVNDPESSDHTMLGLYISVSGDDQTAFEKLEALDQSWWLDNMDRARGSLFLNLQYV